ncbi:MAG: formate dehydrogenase accessory protein FdhE [Negativicutes bacterium]|nr:formate dehydrogenase accessory protein FdhE [Negativicutes bacterium]
MISGDSLTDLLAVIETAADRLEPVQADLFLQEIWLDRIVSGSAALLEGDFPERDAAMLLIAAVASRTEKSLDFTLAQRLVSAYLADRPESECWSEYGISQEHGDLYIHLASQGALARVAQKVAETIPLTAWEYNSCPVCGSGPKFAALDSGIGARRLICGTCFTAWRYKRIGCAFCGEEQPDQLKILTADEFPAWSISACLTCRSYLKTADLRQLAFPPVWHQAALSTLPLDFAAMKWLKRSVPEQFLL